MKLRLSTWALATLTLWLNVDLQPSAESLEIQVTLQHAEYLPIDEALSPGKDFETKFLPHSDEFTWYQVPDWLVGKWHREYEITVGMSDRGVPVSTRRRSKADAVYGHRLDKQGNAWSFIKVPFYQEIESGPYVYYKMTWTFEPTILKNDHLAIRTTSDDVKVLKKSGKIIETCKREELHELAPGQRNSKVTCEMSIRQFDLKGKPILTCGGEYEMDKTGPYTEVAYWTNGEDLKVSLNSWLRRHSLANRVVEVDEAK